MATDTSDRLLEAVWTCVRRGGLAAATSRGIAEEAGANLGAITYHFGSKDELLAEAFVGAVRRLITPALEALRREGTDPVTRVLQAVARLQESLAGTTDEAPAYLDLLLHSRRVPALHARVGDLFSELRTGLASQMVEQKDDGYLPNWVDPEAMAGLLLAVAQGVVLQTTIDPGGPPQTAIANQFAQLLIAGRSPT